MKERKYFNSCDMYEQESHESPVEELSFTINKS